MGAGVLGAPDIAHITNAHSSAHLMRSPFSGSECQDVRKQVLGWAAQGGGEGSIPGAV